MDGLTVTVLYTEFIDLVIRREMTKKARESFSMQERRRFASELAFWMWQNDLGTEIVTNKVPDELFNEFKRPGVPLESVKHDLISGCFLERKPPEGLYFPHRSFLEFFVAERLAEMVTGKNPAVLKISYASPVIVRFFIDLVGKKAIGAWREWLVKLKGTTTVSQACVDLLLTACDAHGLRLTEHHRAEIRGEQWARHEPKYVATEGIEEAQRWKTETPKKAERKSRHRLTGVTSKSHYRKVKS